MKDIIEPFIILPYGNLQDVIFFINEDIRDEYNFLTEMAYSEISDKVIKTNLIKVVNKISETIVFHIYPTSYLEKGSGRTGQNLIVGYIISKTCLGKKSNSLAYACGLFFDTIIKYGCFNMPTLNIQTQFLIKINLGSYNEFINNQLKRTRTQMLLIIKDNRCIDDVRKNIRLQMVYELVKKRSFIPSQYWIRVNSKGILCTKSVSRIV